MPQESQSQQLDGSGTDVEFVATGDAVITEEPLDAFDVGEQDEADSEVKPGQIEHGRLPYPVVGIGASAGGLEAYIELLKNLPSDTGMAFVMVTHLSPDQESHLVQILAQYTAMPIAEAQSGQRPEPDHVYIIPRNTMLSISRGLLQLKPRSSEERVPRPIDYFFRSLASDQRNRAIGVVLSGTASDGALGLSAVKGEGGFAIVQQPETARFSEMPRNGIAAGHVDLILPPDRIARELVRLSARFHNPDLEPLEAGLLPQGASQDFSRLVSLLHGVSGIEFSHYKPATLQRRMARRMMLTQVDNLGEYLKLAQRNPEEVRELQEDILINVTRFFRDPEVWDTLKMDVLPSLFAGRDSGQPVRIWIAGCSTGEEAYSFAICLLEHFAGQPFEPAIQIFGTDASERSIERARLGIYPESLAGEISADRLARFFVKSDRGYQVAKRVRDLCIFARQNLCNDPPFSKLDLVSCRNVLIYLNSELQRQIIPTFHYALRRDGLLLLGGSEAIREFSDLFTPLDRCKFYRRSGADSQGSARRPPRLRVSEVKSPHTPVHAAPHEGWGDVELQRAADRIVLARYGPPGVVVNERMEIVQSRGHTAPYIEMLPGAASLQLLRNVRESIASQVRDAVRRAIDLDIPVQIERIAVRETTDPHQVTLEVLPIQSVSARSRGYLVLFATPSYEGRPAHPGPLPPGAESDEERDTVNQQLRQDLASTKLHLQSLLEERDVKNQELTSANEEIQSSNEELQSTNEELETTKEELQSANEELQTVNEELQQRNAVLLQTGNDLSNLLNSVSLPVLMLDRQLQIRHFTPPAQRLMSIRNADIGRPLSEIRMHLQIDDLEPLLIEVLDTLLTKELEVQDRDGRWYMMRLRPYRTADDKIDGVLLVLIDIDQIRSSQQAVREARDYAQGVIECVQIPIVVLTLELKIRVANSAFREMAELPMERLRDRFFPDLVGTLWGMENAAASLQALTQAPQTAGFEYEHRLAGPDSRTLKMNARAVPADEHHVIIVTLQDLTVARNASELLEGERQRLAGEVQSTVAELGRTQGELRALAAGLFTSQEEERRRVARELHDDVSQQLALIAMELEHCYQQLPDDAGGMHQRLEGLRNRNANLAEGVRRISHRLHPAILDDLGLPYALKALAEEFGEREGMVATFVRRDAPATLPREVAGALYRIAQEALRNVAKHAGRTHAKITLEGTETSVRLEVADLGEGFDPQEGRGGLGLISMEERARLVHGTFVIASALGKGTIVSVDVPLPASEELSKAQAAHG